MRENSEKSRSGSTESRRFSRILFRKTCGYLGIALVCSALLGGVAPALPYFTWALCAFGGIFLAWGWFSYLKCSGSPFLQSLSAKAEGRKKVPQMLKNPRGRHHYRPAFLRENADFDDDLTAAVTVDEELLSEKELSRVRMFSRMAAGGLLFLLSFIL